MKTFKKSAILFLLIFFLGGCWDRTELNVFGAYYGDSLRQSGD